MNTYTASQIHLISRPLGLPTAENFKIERVRLSEIIDQEVLVKNIFMSVDPYMRGRMREDAVYAQAYPLNEVMYGGAIGEVIESLDPNFSPGDIVLNQRAWQDYFTGTGKELTRINPFDNDNLSLYLGTLGMPGLTAYVGLFKFCDPRPGETVFVSAASGAVGANVCQLAKLKGCKVIGSCGSDEKASWLREECGVDEVINYKTCGNLTKTLRAASPEGIDIYFENVGGEHLQAAIDCMNPFGRIAACGMIASYNNSIPEAGPNNLMLIVGKKIRITGFIVSDHANMREQFLSEMIPWIQDGQIKSQETVTVGIDNAVEAFLGLFAGQNFGKMIVKI
jgi:NADPH-dependent curcumin reductase CurA